MAPKRVPADELIAGLAGRQHGVVSVWQLRGLGIGEDLIKARVELGRLHRIHRGVLAAGHSALSSEGRCMAAVLAYAVPTDRGSPSVFGYWRAAVSHRSAASLWGLLDWAPAPVDVVVERTGGRRQRNGIRVHRPRRLLDSEVTLRHGIPVTTAARTLSDLGTATRQRSPGAIVDRELRRAIRQASVLGLPLDEDEPLDRTRSDLETAFLRLCRRHGFPDPEVNVRVGPFLVDFLWRDPRLVVETDAYRYHRGRAAFRDDHRRDLKLRRLGYDVLRVSEEQVDGEPSAVAEEIRRAVGS